MGVLRDDWVRAGSDVYVFLRVFGDGRCGSDVRLGSGSGAGGGDIVDGVFGVLDMYVLARTWDGR